MDDTEEEKYKKEDEVMEYIEKKEVKCKWMHEINSFQPNVISF